MCGDGAAETRVNAVSFIPVDRQRSVYVISFLKMLP